MGYGREIYGAALDELSRRRGLVRQQQSRRRQEIAQKIPEVMDIERRLAQTSLEAARSVLDSTGDIQQQMDRLTAQNKQLQRRYNALLLQHGYPTDYLELHPVCPICEDEGFTDDGQCQCLKELMRKEAYRRINSLTPIASCSFENFSLEYYDLSPLEHGGVSPRQQMETILDYCRHYAKDFSLHSSSILMQGPTGLGKTHLSLSIARAAIDHGFGVVYGSVQNLMSKLEQEKFGRGSNDDSARSLLECDLLILDDLGTEFTTQFVTASIYNLINSRLLSSRPTIINTNLTMQELNDKYTQRITSRIIGGYDRLVFMGRDIRQQKRMGY